MTPLRRILIGLAGALLAGAGANLAAAKTLTVGRGKSYEQPSAAIRAAANGDTVAIDPGEYFDCAIVDKNNLTIAGTGEGVVLTDKVCGGKAILVIDGDNITVRNVTLTRARVPDHNGAGIRAEGGNLVVDHVRFINNENGILSAPGDDTTIRVLDSYFEKNGTCQEACAHAIYAGHIKLLQVERSRFLNTRSGHHVKSRAQRTELVGNTIEDGPEGTASYLVEVPNGGSLVMTDNTLEKGPNCENHSAAIVIGAEGVSQRTGELTFRNNSFINDTAYNVVFVNNLTATEAAITGTRFSGHRSVPLQGDGRAS